MSFRCTNAFVFEDRVYPGGSQVGDDDPILKSHGDNFAKVDESAIRATETTTAVPAEQRIVEPVGAVEPKKAPAKKATAKAATKNPETKKVDNA